MEPYLGFYVPPGTGEAVAALLTALLTWLARGARDTAKARKQRQESRARSLAAKASKGL